MKAQTKTIEKVELMKTEKLFNQSNKHRFHYNFYFEGIEEPLLVTIFDVPLQPGLVGHKIKYKLNQENEVLDFELL